MSSWQRQSSLLHARGSNNDMNSNSPSRLSTNLQPRQPPPLSIQDGADGQRRPSSDSNRSLLASLMRSSNLAEELGDSQCSLDDSDRGRVYSRGGGPGATGSVGSGGSGSGAPGPHKLKRQGSSVLSLSKDADHSDFSSGRCFHDVAGKTNVLMEDKEMVSVPPDTSCACFASSHLHRTR